MSLGDHMLFEFNSQSAREPEEKYQFGHILINQVADAAFCLDANARFLYVNDAFCQMTGYSRQELLLMTLQNIDRDFLQQNWSEQWATLKRQSSITFKSRHQTKAGRIFLVEITINYAQNQGREFGCAFARDNSNELVELSLQRYASKSLDVQQDLQQDAIEYKKNRNGTRNISFSIAFYLRIHGKWYTCSKY